MAGDVDRESIVTGYDIQASRLVHGTMLIDPHIGDEHRDCSKTTFITTSNNHTRPTDSYRLLYLPCVVRLHTDEDDHTSHKCDTHPDGMMRILMPDLNLL